MNKKEYKFLENKLFELNENNIISEEQYKNAKDYFNNQTKPGKSIITIFTSIGFLLVALSVITLFAMNWEVISKEFKVIISFIPIVITAIMMFFSMKKEDKQIKLYTSIIAPISILATNSLITQVFHIQTEIYEMFFTSLLMFMPIAFILRNYLSILVYSAGTVIYALSVNDSWASEAQVLMSVVSISLPIVIYNIINYLKNKNDKKNTLMWVTNVIISTLFIFRFELIREESIFIYCYLIYLITRKLFDKESILSKLFTVFFTAFILISCIDSNVVGFTEEIIWEFDTIILTLLCGLFIYLSKLYKEPKEYFMIAYIAVIQYFAMPSEISFIFINVLTLALGCYKIALGAKNSFYKEIKQGIAIILYLIFIRFMNSDLSFMTKSIIFLVSGVGFMITANIMKKRIGGKKDE